LLLISPIVCLSHNNENGIVARMGLRLQKVQSHTIQNIVSKEWFSSLMEYNFLEHCYKYMILLVIAIGVTIDLLLRSFESEETAI